MSLRRILTATLLSVALMHPAHGLPVFSAMYVFGDSLSDNGNISAVTLGQIPSSPPNFQGRFSNGPTWVEILGLEMGTYAVPVATSFLGDTSGGINFAFGGATSGTTNVGLPGVLPGLQQQLDSFDDFFAGGADPNALYVVWAGANDYLSAVDLNPISVVGNLVGVVNGLYDRGARNFIVPNLPDLSTIPRNLGGAYEDAFAFLSVFHNEYLRFQISELEQNLGGIEIVDMQVDDAFQYLLSNPAEFGLTNTTDACLSGATPCSNPNQHVFWDDIHPTVLGHFILSEFAKISLNEHFGGPLADSAELVAASVPLPAGAWLLLVPMSLLLRGPRRGLPAQQRRQSIRKAAPA